MEDKARKDSRNRAGNRAHQEGGAGGDTGKQGQRKHDHARAKGNFEKFQRQHGEDAQHWSPADLNLGDDDCLEGLLAIVNKVIKEVTLPIVDWVASLYSWANKEAAKGR